MSADIVLPKQVFGHGFLLHRGEKMSKSLGNVVDPRELAAAFGVDALRYFLLREVSFGQDGSYSAEAIVTRINAELANAFGNLAQRTLSFIAKNLEGALPTNGRSDPADTMLIEEVVVACAALKAAFGDLALSHGIEAWLRGVHACNQYIDTQAPWALRKTDPQRMNAVLDLLGAEARDHAAIDDDGWYDRQAASGFRLATPTPAFPRLDLPAAADAA
jgi:methionyl-tRNA synthetase